MTGITVFQRSESVKRTKPWTLLTRGDQTVRSQAGRQLTRPSLRMRNYLIFPLFISFLWSWWPWYYPCMKYTQYHIMFQSRLPEHWPWILVTICGLHTRCNRVLAQTGLFFFTYYPLLEEDFQKAWIICQQWFDLLDKNAQPVHVNYLNSLYTNSSFFRNHVESSNKALTMMIIRKLFAYW